MQNFLAKYYYNLVFILLSQLGYLFEPYIQIKGNRKQQIKYNNIKILSTYTSKGIHCN